MAGRELGWEWKRELKNASDAVMIGIEALICGRLAAHAYVVEGPRALVGGRTVWTSRSDEAGALWILKRSRSSAMAGLTAFEFNLALIHV